MAAMGDYLENKLVDYVFRQQAFAVPATLYVALYTTAPTDITGGTEVTGGSYARVAVTSNLTNWAGTQAAASTVASSGTTGTTSNNVVITYPAPTANWGVVTHFAIVDVSSNIYFWGALTNPKTINNGDAAPSFSAATLVIQLDN